MDEQAGGAAAAVELDSVVVAPGTIRDAPEIRSIDASRYDPTRDREQKRGRIAMVLVWLLVALAAPFALALVRGLCVGLQSGLGWPSATCLGFPRVELIETLQLVLTPAVALVGAATGFCFGEKANDAER